MKLLYLFAFVNAVHGRANIRVDEGKHPDPLRITLPGLIFVLNESLYVYFISLLLKRLKPLIRIEQLGGIRWR